MSDHLREQALQLSVRADSPTLIEDVGAKAVAQLRPGEFPVRFAVTESYNGRWSCAMGIHAGSSIGDSIFRFEKRINEDTSAFNVVMLVPTGVGAEIGGHAGDSTPAAALLASVCDLLITHPNVFNASDIIQIPANAVYVEGSVITRLMMGTARLQQTRSNRLLVLIQSHSHQAFTDAAINAVNDGCPSLLRPPSNRGCDT